MTTSLVIILVALVAFPYTVYPLLLWARALLAPVPVEKGDQVPHVDLVICAHNEAEVIAEKIENALALDYPSDHLNVLVASDGSTDNTVAIAREYSAQGIVCLDLERCGKAAALNTAVASSNSEIIAFSDANSSWRTDALRKLVRSFYDPDVGGVAGDQRYKSDAVDAAGERGYWSFDRQLKRWQSQAGSTISATGAIYAIRRELFQTAPPDATDDFMISTGVIDQGRRLVFDEEATAWEHPASSSGEYSRKVRILTRGLRAVYYRRALLWPPRSGFYAIQLFCHKLWRRLVWVPLLLLLLLTPFYATEGAWQFLLALSMLGILGLGMCGLVWTKLQRYRIIDIAGYVVMVCIACAVASWNSIRARRYSHWSPTGSSLESSS